jgi:hypothetical protein
MATPATGIDAFFAKNEAGVTIVQSAAKAALDGILKSRVFSPMQEDVKTGTVAGVVTAAPGPAPADAKTMFDAAVAQGATVFIAKSVMIPDATAKMAYWTKDPAYIAKSIAEPDLFFYGGPAKGVTPPKKMGMLGFTAIAAVSVGLVWMVLKSGKKSPSGYAPNRRHRRR